MISYRVVMIQSVCIVLIIAASAFAQSIPPIEYNGVDMITTEFFPFAREFSFDPATKYLYLLATNASYHQNLYLVDTNPFVAYPDVVAYDADFSSYFVGTANVSGKLFITIL